MEAQMSIAELPREQYVIALRVISRSAGREYTDARLLAYSGEAALCSAMRAAADVKRIIESSR